MTAPMPATFDNIVVETRDRVGIIRRNRLRRMHAQDDRKEGMRAFVGKRKTSVRHR